MPTWDDVVAIGLRFAPTRLVKAYDAEP